MLYLPNLVQKFGGKIWCNNMESGWEIQGEQLWDGRTYHWEGNCAIDWLWVVKVEVEGEGGTPVEHTYQLKNMYDHMT